MKSAILMSDHKIYISHAWGGESENIVQEIYKRCRKAGLTIIMDRKDLGYRESISSFMQNLGKADAIILVVSNKYLHSEYCMFELLQIYENKNILKRIFPVVLDEVSIAKSTERLELVKYWENETEDLEAKIRELKNLSYIEGITDDLNLYQKIRNNIANLTRILKDINTLNIKLHKDNDYNHLIDAIEKYIAETSTPLATVGLHEKTVGGVLPDVEVASNEYPSTSPEQNFAKKDKPSEGWWSKIFRIFPYFLLVGVLLVGWYFLIRDTSENIQAAGHSSSDNQTVTNQENKIDSAEVSVQNTVREETKADPIKPVNASEDVSGADVSSKTDNYQVKAPSGQKSKSNIDKQIQSPESKKRLDVMQSDVVIKSPEEQKSVLEIVGVKDSPAEPEKDVKPSIRIEKVFIPTSSISVQFPEDISSNTVEEGDIVYLKTLESLQSDDQIIAKSGARVRTRVIDVRASHQGSRGALGLRIESLETVDGQWLELSYHDIIERKRGEVIFKSGTVLDKVEIQPATLDLKIIY